MKVQLHSEFARVPQMNADGSYNIFAAEQKKVIPGFIAVISTDISIAPIQGFYPMILENFNVAKSQVYTSLYNSMHDIEVGATIPRLLIYMRNLGSTEYKIEVGNIIARLIFVRFRHFDVHQVDDINKIIEPKKITAKIANIPKSSAVWFKKIYRADPIEIGSKYFTSNIQKKLDEYKQTEAYNFALNRLNVEANEVWRILTDEIKQKVRDDFALVKISNPDDDLEVIQRNKKNDAELEAAIESRQQAIENEITVDDLDE